MATSGKSETMTTELKDAIVDFFGQMGSNAKDFQQRLILVGGDGLTYEKLIQLKKYMQFHDDPFQRFELLEPTLSAWHTEWTDLSRIYETHWDSILSNDPSSIGHSAAQVGRPAPPNLKKVDYYPCAEFMYKVLDVRMLDCWRNELQCTDLIEHFQSLASTNRLPSIPELESRALKLFRTFSTTRAHYQALHDTLGTSDWAQNVPPGTPWVPALQEKTSLYGPRPLPSRKENKKEPSTPFQGDRVLANSIAFMRDAIISREMSYATAAGDVGRVYECMKVMLFTFAGSSHSKYTNYLMETICNLEYESGPALRDGILKTMLVNLTGRDGAFSATDMIQEFFNRLLEAIVEKKGVKYGATFIREVISRNLHHFARIKLDLRAGVGLTRHSTAHTAPHMNAETAKLLDTYRTCELHKRRPGRIHQDRDVDDFSRGLARMQDGKVTTWVSQTTRDRELSVTSHDVVNASMLTIDDDEIDEPSNETPTARPSFGFMEVIDGQLVVSTADDNYFDDLIGTFESEYGEEDAAIVSTAEH
ncbi:hypothetical protein H0H92_005538 [Tricholoma furcatifolium]|nr:hypothetical protein H0H92_005538 [Tricholoma furcatifolium]